MGLIGSSVIRRAPKNVEAAVQMVARRTGRAIDDAVIVVTRSALDEKRKTPAGVQTLAEQVISVISFMDSIGTPVLEAGRADILRYANSNEEWALGTQSVKLVGARAFYAQAAESGAIAESPAQRLPRIGNEDEQTEHHTKPLSEGQIVSVLDAITEDYGHPDRDLAARRDHAIILLMVRTGLREFEAAGLIKGGITRNASHWDMAFMGKGRRPAALKLPDDVYDDLARWWKAFEIRTGITVGPRDPVFTQTAGSRLKAAVEAGRLGPKSWMHNHTFNKLIKARFAAVDIEVPGMAAHSLRATCAVLAYYAGADLLEIQQLLRHKSLETTRIYLSHILPQASARAIDAIKLDLK
jgi:integrase